jgi:hypothetical protein
MKKLLFLNILICTFNFVSMDNPPWGRLLLTNTGSPLSSAVFEITDPG